MSAAEEKPHQAPGNRRGLLYRFVPAQRDCLMLPIFQMRDNFGADSDGVNRHRQRFEAVGTIVRNTIKRFRGRRPSTGAIVTCVNKAPQCGQRLILNPSTYGYVFLAASIPTPQGSQNENHCAVGADLSAHASSTFIA